MTKKSVVLTICLGVRRKPVLEAVLLSDGTGNIVVEGVKEKKLAEVASLLRTILHAIDEREKDA